MFKRGLQAWVVIKYSENVDFGAADRRFKPIR